MKRRRSGRANRKEMMIMTASSVLVLTAMTVTGVSIYRHNQPKEQQENVVDFSALENGAQEKNDQIAQAQNPSAKNLTSKQENSGELDYDPYYVEQERRLNEQDAREIENASGLTVDEAEGIWQEGAGSEAQTGNIGYAEVYRDKWRKQDESETGTEGEASGGEEDSAGSGTENGSDEAGDTDAGNGADAGDGSDAGNGPDAGDGLAAEDGLDAGTAGEAADAGAEAAEAAGEALQEAVADVMQEEISLHFSEEAKLQWPIAGNVLLNYSMDKTVYFQTLQQYKYNPSIVIGATQGTSVACAANGVVKSIYKDPQTGTTVVMNLGDGYELSYGQLQEIMVEEGDFVEAGAFIAKVAAPTKYYTVEGTNVYFKLTKDGEPVNPMNYLG